MFWSCVCKFDPHVCRSVGNGACLLRPEGGEGSSGGVIGTLSGLLSELYRVCYRNYIGTLSELYRNFIGTVSELYRNCSGTLSGSYIGVVIGLLWLKPRSTPGASLRPSEDQLIEPRLFVTYEPEIYDARSDARVGRRWRCGGAPAIGNVISASSQGLAGCRAASGHTLFRKKTHLLPSLVQGVWPRVVTRILSGDGKSTTGQPWTLESSIFVGIPMPDGRNHGRSGTSA